jgi:hypothetical protein
MKNKDKKSQSTRGFVLTGGGFVGSPVGIATGGGTIRFPGQDKIRYDRPQQANTRHDETTQANQERQDNRTQHNTTQHTITQHNTP